MATSGIILGHLLTSSLELIFQHEPPSHPLLGNGGALLMIETSAQLSL